MYSANKSLATVTIPLAEYELLVKHAGQASPDRVVIPPAPAPEPANAPAFDVILSPVIVEKLLRGVTTKQENLSPDDFDELLAWSLQLVDAVFMARPFTPAELHAEIKRAGVDSRFDVVHFILQSLAREGRLAFNPPKKAGDSITLHRIKSA